MIISTEQLALLKKLKEIDHIILGVQIKKKEAPNLLETLETKVAGALAHKDQANAKLEELQLVQMQIEEDIKNNNDLLIRAKEKLQDISNDREFKAATKEVDQIGNIIKTKTIELPPAVEHVGFAKKELEDKAQLLKASEEERGACPVDINELYQSLDDEIKKINVERITVTEKVDKSILSLYEITLAKRGGLALVPATGGSCSACRVRVRPQVYNQVLQGNLEECDSCRRLLFAE